MRPKLQQFFRVVDVEFDEDDPAGPVRVVLVEERLPALRKVEVEDEDGEVVGEVDVVEAITPPPLWQYEVVVNPDGAIASLTISPTGELPPGGLGTAVTHDLALGDVRAAIRRRLSEIPVEPPVATQRLRSFPADRERWTQFVAGLEARVAAMRAAEEGRGKPPGRARVPVDELIEAALVYSSACAEGRGRAATEDVAAALGCSYSTARNRVRSARAADLLPPTVRGTARGGDVEALRVLAESPGVSPKPKPKSKPKSRKEKGN